ncbi:hypothetical protein K439DRAFT_978709 [Ramaria rubella]|nr:hypothetical protein K439DRAFT_978709 [Ramaria rubella]
MLEDGDQLLSIFPQGDLFSVLPSVLLFLHTSSTTVCRTSSDTRRSIFLCCRIMDFQGYYQAISFSLMKMREDSCQTPYLIRGSSANKNCSMSNLDCITLFAGCCITTAIHIIIVDAALNVIDV